MGRKNRRKHMKIRPIKASKYIKNKSTSSGLYTPAKPKGQYNPRPRRGDIWFAKLGNHYDTSVQSGTRPVLIISNDTGNRYSKTYTVLPMTSKLKKPDLPTHVELTVSSCVLTTDDPLEDSMLLAEQIVTIDKSALLEKVAFVTDGKKLSEIERAVRVHLGIAGEARAAGQQSSDTAGQQSCSPSAPNTPVTPAS